MTALHNYSANWPLRARSHQSKLCGTLGTYNSNSDVAGFEIEFCTVVSADGNCIISLPHDQLPDVLKHHGQ